MERLTIPDEKIEGGVRRILIDSREVKKNAMTIYWALKKYEDTGLNPKQIQELKEAVHRLDKIFGDEITVNQVIDFFLDFYIANGDPCRVESAELLTNEEVAKYRSLKERDKEKPLMERHYEEPGEEPYIKYTCPNGCRIQPSRRSKFCSLCGQRLKWNE